MEELIKIKKDTLPAGIEPATFRLTAERSTYWAIGASLHFRAINIVLNQTHLINLFLITHHFKHLFKH